MSSAQYVSYESRAAEGDGTVLYGLDRDLADKAKAKYDPRLEAEARTWIESVLEENLGPGTLQEELKSGEVLCRLANKIKPGSVGKISAMKMPFKQMENIGNYLSACSALGMPAFESFQTVDLFENKNMLAVVTNLHALGRRAQKVPGYTGPALGVKLADVNKRNFTAEQMAEARAAPTLMGKGSHGGASQAGTVDHRKCIVKTGHIDGIEGLGSSEATAIGMGSAGCASQAGSFDHSKSIHKTRHIQGIEGLGSSSETTAIGMGSSGCASQAGGTGFGKREISHLAKVTGGSTLPSDGEVPLWNRGSVGLASRVGMELHGKREIVPGVSRDASLPVVGAA
jgi:hypothetical protein